MSETTELRKPTLTEIEVAKKINARIAHWQGYAENSLNGQQITGLILGVLVESRPTPPASEPSEQPNAEDAEAHFMKYLRGLIIAAWKNGHGLWNSSEDFAYTHYDYDVLPALKKLVSQYARHASARAVEAERQRLARLLVEEHRAIDELLKSTVLSKSELDCVPTKRAALQKFKSWLAGEKKTT